MEDPRRVEVTALLADWGRGDAAALDRLLPLVYDELRRLARRHMRGERPGSTLQTTALVHDAYLRLVDYERVQPRDRRHFLALAAQAMRRILVDHARRRDAARRGGGGDRLPLEAAPPVAAGAPEEVLDLDRALHKLATLDPRQERVVELRWFGGLSIDETAEVLGVAAATVERDWSAARLWLRRELAGGEAAG